MLRSFRFAGAGLRYLIHTQPNFWVHGLAAVVVVLLILVLAIPVAEAGVLILAIGLVLALEAVNSAIEAIVDLISPDYHPVAKVAKDAAAAGVLIAAIVAAIVGVAVLLPPLLTLLGF